MQRHTDIQINVNIGAFSIDTQINFSSLPYESIVSRSGKDTEKNKWALHL
jgi:hypothetical protein